MNNIPKILQDALRPFAPPALSYETRVQALEDEGLTRSDAQAVVDAEDMQPAPKPSPTELVIRALVLGLTAPNAKAAQQCADMAEEFAQGLTDDQVEQCKADAMRRAGLCGTP